LRQFLHEILLVLRFVLSELVALLLLDLIALAEHELVIVAALHLVDAFGVLNNFSLVSFDLLHHGRAPRLQGIDLCLVLFFICPAQLEVFHRHAELRLELFLLELASPMRADALVFEFHEFPDQALLIL